MARFHLLAAPLALVAMLSLAPMAHADNDMDKRAARIEALKSASVDATAAIAAVRAAGYPTVASVDWEKGHWEVKALDAQGKRAKLDVDAKTGAVTPHAGKHAEGHGHRHGPGQPQGTIPGSGPTQTN